MSDKGIDLVQYGERKVAEERKRIKDAILREFTKDHEVFKDPFQPGTVLKRCLEIVEGENERTDG